ncbi:Carbon monoxide dehydrogenase medium chain [plant metagenome]|uniref:Carbon monoxide dehydrogenase medium chain n=1 Tax=plant metagenome TaxID=1297885 RepID=A0A484S6P5_9ZZZZ
MKAARFDYARPGESGEAIALLTQSEGMGKPVAGGQSLGPMMNMRLAQPELLVDLRAVAGQADCVERADSVQLGAGVTHAQIEDGIAPDATRGLMPYVARGIAYRAVRTRGTLGGSLAHADGAADWINVMPLLDACCRVAGPQGEREVACVDWMQGTFTTVLAEDEILRAVRIPRLSASARWSYYKFNRKPGEFAEAIAAFIDDPERGVCRGVIGALDGPPHVIAQARLLLDELRASGLGPMGRAELQAAGLEAGSYEYRVHAVALSRAAQALDAGLGARSGDAS